MACDDSNGGITNRDPSILSMRTKAELNDFVEALFRREGSADALGVDPAQLRTFIRRVSRHYRGNPYHNYHHAVDTVNTTGWMISLPVLRAGLPVHERFVMLLTALIHDIEHPGHNNQWEVQNGSPLARKYDNEAVLEKHSYDVTLRLMADPALDLLAPFSPAQAARWLAFMEKLVLATDFAAHRRFLDEFRDFLATHPHDFGDEAFRTWVCCAVIKAADIANTSKPYDSAKVWGVRIMLEFWAQGVLEKQHRLPVGPLNDPESVKLNAAQAGFIRFAVLELFELLERIEPGFGELLDNLRANLEVYEEKARQGEGLFEQ